MELIVTILVIMLIYPILCLFCASIVGMFERPKSYEREKLPKNSYWYYPNKNEEE